MCRRLLRSLIAVSVYVVAVTVCAQTPATVHPLAYVSGGHSANTGTREAAVAPSDGDATYITMSTSDDSTYFTVPAFAISAVAGSIDVSVSEECKLASGAMQHYPGIKVNGIDYSPTAYAMTSGYVVNTTTWATNPNTAAEWLEAEVEQISGAQLEQVIANAAQMTGGDEVRCTEIAIMVTYTNAATGHTQRTLVGVGE